MTPDRRAAQKRAGPCWSPLTFLLWLPYRPLTLGAEPAVVLAPDPAPELVDLPKEIT